LEGEAGVNILETTSTRKLFIILLAAVLVGGTAEAQNSYSTNFPLTENPISEGGRWINGASTGLDWKNCRTMPGRAFGTQAGATPPPYDDSTCVLSGTWGREQSVEATVVVASPTGSQEVELRLLTTITAHRIVGYEVMFSVTNNPYVEIMRWDGGTTLPAFHSVQFGYGPQLQTGYRIKATVTAAGLFKAYVDSGSGYVLIIQGTDTTYTTGAPGIGFYNVGSGSNANFGLSSFSASDGTGLTAPAAPSTVRILR
jgi:hypothetical protein